MLRQKRTKKGDPKTMYDPFSGPPRRTIDLCTTVLNSSGSLIGSQPVKDYFFKERQAITFLT